MVLTMTPVTDPNQIAELESSSQNNLGTPVTDPAVIAQLEGNAPQSGWQQFQQHPWSMIGNAAYDAASGAGGELGKDLYNTANFFTGNTNYLTGSKIPALDPNTFTIPNSVAGKDIGAPLGGALGFIGPQGIAGRVGEAADLVGDVLPWAKQTASNALQGAAYGGLTSPNGQRGVGTAIGAAAPLGVDLGLQAIDKGIVPTASFAKNVLTGTRNLSPEAQAMNQQVGNLPVPYAAPNTYNLLSKIPLSGIPAQQAKVATATQGIANDLANAAQQKSNQLSGTAQDLANDLATTTKNNVSNMSQPVVGNLSVADALKQKSNSVLGDIAGDNTLEDMPNNIASAVKQNYKTGLDNNNALYQASADANDKSGIKINSLPETQKVAQQYLDNHAIENNLSPENASKLNKFISVPDTSGYGFNDLNPDYDISNYNTFNKLHTLQKNFSSMAGDNFGSNNNYVGTMFNNMSNAIKNDMETAVQNSGNPDLYQKLQVAKQDYIDNRAPYETPQIQSIVRDKANLNNIHNTLLQNNSAVNAVVNQLPQDVKGQVALLKMRGAVSTNPDTGAYEMNPQRGYGSYGSLLEGQRQKLLTPEQNNQFQGIGSLLNNQAANYKFNSIKQDPDTGNYTAEPTKILKEYQKMPQQQREAVYSPADMNKFSDLGSIVNHPAFNYQVKSRVTNPQTGEVNSDPSNLLKEASKMSPDQQNLLFGGQEGQQKLGALARLQPYANPSGYGKGHTAASLLEGLPVAMEIATHPTLMGLLHSAILPALMSGGARLGAKALTNPALRNAYLSSRPGTQIPIGDQMSNLLRAAALGTALGDQQ